MSFKDIVGSAALKIVEKTFGVSTAARAWLAGEDDKRTQSRPTKPYRQVELVYICTNKLIDGILGLPPVISDIDENIIEAGPAYDFLFNNKSMNFERLITETIGHYALTRDVFWVFNEMNGNKPVSIQVVSGTQMRAITSDLTGELIGWEYSSGSRRIPLNVNEVWQWKNFNPYDPSHGLGPATAGKLSIDYSYAATLFNTSALENGAELGPIILPEARMDEDQIRLFRAQFESRHKGAANANRPVILPGVKDIKTVAKNMVDMQVAELTGVSDAKICALFGVPVQLVGLKTEAQYSAGPANRDFIFNTIIPLSRLFAGQLTNGILAKFYRSEQTAASYRSAKFYQGNTSISIKRNSEYRKAVNRAVSSNKQLFVWFDSDQHPVVQEARREVATAVLQYTRSGVPLNQLIVAHDLPYEEVPWGNDWLVNMGLVPARSIIDGTVDTTGDVSLPEGGDQPADEPTDDETGNHLPFSYVTKDDEARKLRIWKNWVTSWAGLEREYSDAMRKYFLRQQRELIDRLKAAVGDKGTKTSDDIVAHIVFDLKKDNGKLKVINNTYFGRGTELGIRQTLSEALGLTGDELDKRTQEVKTQRWLLGKMTISTTKITEVNATTKKLLEHSLKEGLEKGEGLTQLADRIKDLTGKSLARSRSIARTQTAGAVGSGRHAGLSASGLKKAWLDSHDDVVRPAHRQAGIDYKNGIATGEPFIVSDESLMYPADPAGSAGNIINCRCVELAVAGQAASVIETYINHKFLSYEQMETKNASPA